MVLDKTIGVISLRPCRRLKEGYFLEIHVRTSQHYVPNGVAHLQPPFALAGKVGREQLVCLAVKDFLERVAGILQTFTLLGRTARHRVRRQGIRTIYHVLS
jgi:hypothetical protein